MNSNSFVSNSVRVYVSFSGKVNHISGETHAHHISQAQREETVSLFQEKIMAPSKLYHKKLMQLSSEQYVSGNRDAQLLCLKKYHQRHGFRWRQTET